MDAVGVEDSVRSGGGDERGQNEAINQELHHGWESTETGTTGVDGIECGDHEDGPEQDQEGNDRLGEVFVTRDGWGRSNLKVGRGV